MSFHRSPRIVVPLAIITVTASILLAMGRPPICTCGYVSLWHWAVDSGNSQHIFDWYSPSHVVHGLLFYAGGWLLFRRWPVTARFNLALALEAAWEIVENTPFIINRYRTATIALGYTGDSVINSLSDIGCMGLGFLIARRLPWLVTLGIAVSLELLTLYVIRDNLTLNILMLIAPVDAIGVWQAG